MQAATWAFISDPASVASCLPDVTETKVIDDRHVDAKVKVAVGPVRGSFTFKIALEPQDGPNRMNLKISGGGLGSVVDVVAGANLQSANPLAVNAGGSGNVTIDGDTVFGVSTSSVSTSSAASNTAATSPTAPTTSWASTTCATT